MESFRDEQDILEIDADGANRSPASVLADFRAHALQLLQVQRQRAVRLETQVMSKLQLVMDELHESRLKLARLSREYRELQEELERVREDAGGRNPLTDMDIAELQEHLERIRAERDDLLDQLQSVQEESSRKTVRESSELQERLELAVREIRELKNENAALKERGSARNEPAAFSDHETATGPTFDWETQKKRLLAQLESDFDTGNPQEKRDRLTVEGAIRITDQVVAEKDQELAELRRLLENQASNLGAVAVGASAVAAMVDQDELVREQKEQLRAQQQEWREKLRRAEVEISVERAKIARERLELEEKLRSLQASRGESTSSSADSTSGDKNKGRPRSRWLTRLGLHDET